MEKHFSSLEVHDYDEKSSPIRKRPRRGIRRWWRKLSKNDRRFYLFIGVSAIVATAILVYSIVSTETNYELEQSGEAADEIVESEEIDGDLEEVEEIEIEPLSSDGPFRDELYSMFVDSLRSSWGDGSNPTVTPETSTNSLIYSFSNVKGLPDLNDLYARDITGNLSSDDGVAFYTAEGKLVISFYFDDTAIRVGDTSTLRFSRAKVSVPTESPRLPISNKTTIAVKNQTNEICKAAFSPTALSKAARFAPFKSSFVDNKVNAADFLPLEYYEPLFLFVDFSAPADGVYIQCQPSLGSQAMRVKYIERTDTKTGYLIESISLVGVDASDPGVISPGE